MTAYATLKNVGKYQRGMSIRKSKKDRQHNDPRKRQKDKQPSMYVGCIN